MWLTWFQKGYWKSFMNMQYGFNKSLNRIKQKTKHTTLSEQFQNPIKSKNVGRQNR